MVALRPGVPVVILTAFATMETAIEAIRAGAYDYLSKPFRMDEIRLMVRRTLEAQRLARENRQYRAELRERYRVDNLVGQSPAMVDVYKLVARVAALDTTVLILGETGTGKELVARAIHYASPRSHRPFVVVDCTALPETLFESELFGHERGAFTGAVATGAASSSRPTGAPSSSTRSASCRPRCRRSSSACCRNGRCAGCGDNDLDPRRRPRHRRDAPRSPGAGRAGRVPRGSFYRLNVVTIAVPAAAGAPRRRPAPRPSTSWTSTRRGRRAGR